MSIWKKLFGSSHKLVSRPSKPITPAPERSKPTLSPQSINLVDEVKDIIRKTNGARDFLSQATQAGWRKIKEDFIGIYLQKADETLIFGVLPSKGPDTIWNLMMTESNRSETVKLITEGKIVFDSSSESAQKPLSETPSTNGTTNSNIQDEFDQLWVSASKIRKKKMLQGNDPGEKFIKLYIYENMAAKYNLDPEDFSKLESNFLMHWSPSFSEGWERK